MVSKRPFKSLASYSRFVAEQLDRPSVQRSTVVVWSDSPYTGTAEGEVWFVGGGIRLRMHEEIDFDSEGISSYGYEVYLSEIERLLD